MTGALKGLGHQPDIGQVSSLEKTFQASPTPQQLQGRRDDQQTILDTCQVASIQELLQHCNIRPIAGSFRLLAANQIREERK